MAAQRVEYHNRLRADITRLLTVIEAHATDANGRRYETKRNECIAALQAAENAQVVMTDMQTANFEGIKNRDTVLHEFVLWNNVLVETQRVKNSATLQFSEEVPVKWKDLEGLLVRIEHDILKLRIRVLARMTYIDGLGR